MNGLYNFYSKLKLGLIYLYAIYFFLIYVSCPNPSNVLQWVSIKPHGLDQSHLILCWKNTNEAVEIESCITLSLPKNCIQKLVAWSKMSGKSTTSIQKTEKSGMTLRMELTQVFA